MLENLSVSHFKCFENQSLSLKPLTVLTGVNASGKSSFIHALTLLHQSAVEHMWGAEIPLNGETLSLGSANDVVDKGYGRKEINIAASGSNYSCEWNLSVPENKDCTFLELDKSSFSYQGKCVHDTENFFKTLPFKATEQFSSIAVSFTQRLENMTYISADRLGPRETHPNSWSSKYKNVGARGERTVWYLSQHSDTEVEPELRIERQKPQLIPQVQARMGRLFPGYEMDIKALEGTNLAKLSLMTDSSIGFVRPQNIGVGLSYTLPIWTACLGARKNDIVIIENPEVHLHPQAQSQMGAFLAEVARAGIQLIIETHSDHVINGIRKSVKDKTIDSQSVALYFFRPRETEENSKQVTPIKIAPNGSIRNSPSGFFDQIDKDLDILLGI